MTTRNERRIDNIREILAVIIGFGLLLYGLTWANNPATAAIGAALAGVSFMFHPAPTTTGNYDEPKPPKVEPPKDKP